MNYELPEGDRWASHKRWRSCAGDPWWTRTRDGEKYQKLRWKFIIIDPGSDFDGKSTIGETGAKPIAAPDCVLWVWAQEVFGQELPGDFVLDTDDLIGRKVQIRIGHRKYTKDGVDKVFVHAADVARTSVPFVAQQAQAPAMTTAAAIQPLIIAEDSEPPGLVRVVTGSVLDVLAGQATPVPAPVYSGVALVVWVAMGAVGLGSLAVVCGVGPVGEEPEVPRVAASAYPAEVVDGEAGRDRAICEGERNTMGHTS